MQADLVDMQKLTKFNESYKYILVLIDCFSRKAFLCAVKSKSSDHVAPALEKLFSQSGAPLRLQTDRGTEFYGKASSELFKRLGVLHFSGTTSPHAHIAERFNRTLKSILYKFLEQKSTRRWVGHLPQILATYNDRRHRGIDFITPNMAEMPAYKDHMLRVIRSKLANVKPERIKFQIGDKVRILLEQEIFRKGYKYTFSTEKFEVVKIIPTKIPMYTLKSRRTFDVLDGNFYSHELQRTNE